MTAEPRIAIVGAGLGGLTAAIALALRGFAVEVFEQAAELGEAGAGLTVSRSAQAVFAEIGLLDSIQKIASATPRMAWLHYQTGALQTGIVDRSDGRWSPASPPGGLHIHRADVHALLVARFEALAPGRLHTAKRLTEIESAADPVRLRFADGTAAEADLVIGADGIRSAVRAALWGATPARFTGQIAFRFMVPGDIAAPFLAEAGRAALFQGPGRVFNRYTLRGGDIVNCVAITQSDSWQGEGWSTPGSREELLALYDGWHPDATGMMAIAPPEHLIKWALFDRPPLDRWTEGAVALLGDAAHPMLPFLGLGAAMAIEDAMVLARVLAESPDPAGLARYAALRQPRTRLIADLSRVQGELSQRRDPEHYDPAASPAQDPSIQTYDPVTTPLELDAAS